MELFIFGAGALLLALTVAVPLAGYKLTTRASRRYPAAPRTEAIDLAKERYEFESRRDSYLEAKQLGRVV